MPDLTIAVTGATGFVGRCVVRELLSRGWHVHALVRDHAKAAATLPRNDRLRLVAGDVATPAALAALVAATSACVNTIGIIRETGSATFQRAHVDATRGLIDACRDAGTRRFVHISALGVRDHAPTRYQQTKFTAEQLLRRSGLDWTILRPSLIHGPEGEFIRLAKGWASGGKPPFFFLPYFVGGGLASDVPLAPLKRDAASVQPVAVEDVARAVAAAIERPDAIGEVYNLVGPETLTWPDVLTAIRDAVPGSRPDLEPRPIQSEHAVIAAIAAKAVGLGSLLPFDAGMATMGAEDSTAEADKARIDLGLAPAPFRAALAGYAGRIA
ncbi:MAG: NAD(P)H-binding protein [Phycisphaerales bacterium]